MTKPKSEVWLGRTKKNVVEGRTENYWIKVKKKNGFVDVLIGKKGEEAHIHFGLNPDTSHKFIQDRGKVKNIRRDRIMLNGEKVLIDELKFSDKESDFIIDFNYRLTKIDEKSYKSDIEKIIITERKKDKSRI